MSVPNNRLLNERFGPAYCRPVACCPVYTFKAFYMRFYGIDLWNRYSPGVIYRLASPVSKRLITNTQNLQI